MLASTHIIAGGSSGKPYGRKSCRHGRYSCLCHPAGYRYGQQLFGRRVPIIPQLLKHRGVTHSLLMLVIEHGLTNHYFGPDWAPLLYPWLGLPHYPGHVQSCRSAALLAPQPESGYAPNKNRQYMGVRTGSTHCQCRYQNKYIAMAKCRK